MDDRRFDSLVKALAEGRSRRTVLKGLLGLSGAAMVGSTLVEGDTDAARRPTPTPTPPKCPGQQTYDPGTKQCICQTPKAPGPHICGPSCCTGLSTDPVPGPVGHTECCDQACCLGTCMPEEHCCPTNLRAGGLDPSHQICASAAGDQCCPFEQACCSVDGCCDTFCYGGPLEVSFCCPSAQACPGGSDTDDDCCNAGETCCGGGTNENYCADFSTGGCCETSDCPPPANGACASECVAGQCQPVSCTEGLICCEGECVSSQDFTLCPTDPAGCCDSETETCCGASGCCPAHQCNEIGGDCCQPDEQACSTGENACCAPPLQCCGSGAGRVCCQPGLCTSSGVCCTGDNVACGDNCCLSNQCNQQTLQCCEPGSTPCAEGCCVVDPCENVVCLPACTHCEGGECVADADFTPCDGGYCRNGICHPCISNSPPEPPQFSCSLDEECCSGCCLNAAAAANACQTQFEGFPDLLAACNEYLAPFLGGDVCVQNPLPFPGNEEGVYLPCQGVV